MQKPFDQLVVERVSEVINQIHGVKAMFGCALCGLDFSSNGETNSITTECDNDVCPCKVDDQWDDLEAIQ